MKNYLEQIKELYAFVSVDEGGEGVIGQVMQNPGQPPIFMPFVCADKDRMESLKPLAKNIAKEQGIKVRLIKLTQRDVIDEYDETM